MKYIKIFLCVCLGLGASSCADWFDVKPKTEILAEDLFKTESGFWSALTGVYINMGHSNAYGKNLSWGAIEFMGWNHRNSTQGSLYDELQRGYFTNDKPQTFINDTWLKLYNVIAETNYLLYALEEYGGYLRPAVYKNIEGQCLAIRAYCHFDLLRLFAAGNLAADPTPLDEMRGVPYAKVYGQKIVDQTSYRKTLELALNDAEDAVACFETAYAQGATAYVSSSEMTRFAAELLCARINLWMGDYTNALGYAQGLVNRNEASSVWGIDRNVNTGSFETELLFWMNNYKLWSYMEPSSYKMNNGERLQSATKDAVREGLYFRTSEKANYCVGPGDMRLSNWYYNHTDADESLSGDYSVKMLNLSTVAMPGDGSNAYPKPSDGLHNVVPLMRISEAYLIAAECQMNKATPNVEEARKLVNEVRKKRGNSDTYDVKDNVTNDEMKDIIMYEQLREFAQEGQAFFLYKRLGTTMMVNSSETMTTDRYVLPYPEEEQRIGHNNTDKYVDPNATAE